MVVFCHVKENCQVEPNPTTSRSDILEFTQGQVKSSVDIKDILRVQLGISFQYLTKESYL